MCACLCSESSKLVRVCLSGCSDNSVCVSDSPSRSRVCARRRWSVTAAPSPRSLPRAAAWSRARSTARCACGAPNATGSCCSIRHLCTWDMACFLMLLWPVLSHAVPCLSLVLSRHFVSIKASELSRKLHIPESISFFASHVNIARFQTPPRSVAGFHVTQAVANHFRFRRALGERRLGSRRRGARALCRRRKRRTLGLRDETKCKYQY